ncbi:MAG: RsmB/NOP family class I SAM-dependent RNA methyltransferase [Burkholderiaceae bacterium]
MSGYDETSRRRDVAAGRRKEAAGLPVSIAARALESVLAFTQPADGALRAFFRSQPKMGRRDRAAAADSVFDVLRNRRFHERLAEEGDGPVAVRLLAVSRIRRGLPVPGVSPGEPLPDWLMQARDADPAQFDFAVRYSLPDWLAEALRARPDAEALAAALLEPAPLDLRVNVARTDRDKARVLLAADGIETVPLAIAPQALRVQGKPSIETSRAFEQGWVEVQDAGSQLLAALVGARRGQVVVDFCAGAGGKSLALAAAMRATGQVFACDVSAARLQRLRPRLQRAGAGNVQPMVIDGEQDRRLERLAGRADAVLVDAPCSGTGTLRRNPELKWRLDAGRLDALPGEQRAILAAAARLVKPGGVLVYATCSLLDDENEAQALDFESTHPEFEREHAGGILPGLGDADGFLRLYPHRDGVDGFFAARWRRR